MMLAGFVGYTASWAAGTLITVPGGFVILAAFAVVRRADLVEGRAPSTAQGGYAVALLAAFATLISGGVMLLAGVAIVRLGVARGTGPGDAGRATRRRRFRLGARPR